VRVDSGLSFTRSGCQEMSRRWRAHARPEAPVMSGVPLCAGQLVERSGWPLAV